MASAEKRFWLRVDKSGSIISHLNTPCWEWIGGGSNGYGRFIVDGRPITTHRFSYELHYGTIPENKIVRHRCDNPPCVRPEHLLLGSVQDNVNDKMKRGRHKSSPGILNGMSSLSEEDVKNIFSDFYLGMNQKNISKKYDVSKQHISDILRGKRWKYLNLGISSELFARGSESGRAKFIEKDILLIRNLYKTGISRKDIMNQFSMCSSTLHYILNRKTWTHV